MDTIRLIRAMHADFVKSERIERQLEAKRRERQERGDSEFGELEDGPFSACSEVCVKTSEGTWIVGRRASQTHREFFVLVDGKVGNLSDVQGKRILL